MFSVKNTLRTAITAIRRGYTIMDIFTYGS